MVRVKPNKINFHDFFHAGRIIYLFKFAAVCHVGYCLVLGRPSIVQNQAENSLPPNSSIDFPATVSHDYSVILLGLNNIFCPKKLSVRRVYLAVVSFDSRQQQSVPVSDPVHIY